jgi:pseudaminic acid biosynthesis-associated methylase
MTDHESPQSEASRLESLWADDFGDEYARRNTGAGDGRDAFWTRLLQEHPVETALEIGCNVGANLRWLSGLLPSRAVWGIDINESALQTIRKRLPAINAVWSPARDLPFRDRTFDLVFTAGVLIHQPESTLPLVMAEAVRCSRRFVLALEYFAGETTEVRYRGNEGALFKRDYGRLYQELFPDLQPVADGALGADEGWDDVRWWLFRRDS